MVFGNERAPEAVRTLRVFARAAMVKRQLRGTRIAVLPSPCRVVMGTLVDELHLLERFGVELVYVSVEQYAALVEAVSARDADEYVAWLKSNATNEGVDDDVLGVCARQALAKVRLAEEEGLSGIALEDFNEAFYRLLGWRPHLTHPRLGELGCTVGLEADVPGVLATIIVSRLAGRPGMFNEFYSIDRQHNAVLMGHPGMGELAVGEPETFVLTPDLEFDASQPRGVWLSYRAKPGPMTFLNLTPEYGRLKAAVFTGESLPGPRLMEGYAHMLIRPATEADTLFQRAVRLGLVQHWGTVHGHLGAELRALDRMLGLDMTFL